MSPDCFYNILTKLLILYICHKYPLKQWAVIHNLYLQKDPGNFCIHQLQMIHIIKAELNLIQSELVARQMTANAEKYTYFHDGQCGGRKGQAAIDIPMLKVFTIDNFYLMQANAAFTDYNAKACYDRVVAIITGLVQHKSGLPLHACQFFIRALNQMRYYVITAYGQSQQYNKHGKTKLLQGIGKGPCDAPLGLDTIADIIMKCYEENA
eukprot:15129793-Ditylum_brightwellii.AAC.1